MNLILKILGKFPESIKNTLKESNYGKKLRYILNFNQEVIDEFIINVVRTEVLPGSKILDA